MPAAGLYAALYLACGSGFSPDASSLVNGPRAAACLRCAQHTHCLDTRPSHYFTLSITTIKCRLCEDGNKFNLSTQANPNLARRTEETK
jgi:hypothetical protein